MFWVKHPQRKILSVYVPVANAIWQPHDLHLIWKSAWEWGGTAHVLQAAGKAYAIFGGAISPKM